MFNLEELGTLVASTITDWMNAKSDWERNIMLRLARSGRILSFGYFIVGSSTLVFGYYMRFGYFFQNIHQPRRYLVYRFDSIQKTPNYEITFILQSVGAAMAVMGNYSVDSFVSIFVLHICAQLINLRTTLKNLIDKLDHRSISSIKFRKNLTAIVIRHEYLIRYAFNYYV